MCHTCGPLVASSSADLRAMLTTSWRFGSPPFLCISLETSWVCAAVRICRTCASTKDYGSRSLESSIYEYSDKNKAQSGSSLWTLHLDFCAADRSNCEIAVNVGLLSWSSWFQTLVDLCVSYCVCSCESQVSENYFVGIFFIVWSAAVMSVSDDAKIDLISTFQVLWQFVKKWPKIVLSALCKITRCTSKILEINVQTQLGLTPVPPPPRPGPHPDSGR